MGAPVVTDDGVEVRRALVVGLGGSGQAASRHLLARGVEVLAMVDSPDEATRELARELVIELREATEDVDLASTDLVVTSPGVPEGHGLLQAAAAAGVPVWSEVELAGRALTVPVVAVTGTNGKTSVVGLITAMLEQSGQRPVAAGNIGLALCDVVDDVAAGTYDVVVAEVSSFQLRFTSRFHPRVAVWLNVAPDHLDWHPTFEAYVQAKGAILANQEAGDVAVVNAEDRVVMAAVAGSRARTETFSSGSATNGPAEDGGSIAARWRVVGGVLVGPGGIAIEVGPRARLFAHERANCAAAAAAAFSLGATPAAVSEVLARYQAPAHRLALVAEVGGVSWYDDSKATNPAAAVVAIGAFDSVVLIAGGRNKGLDLGAMAGVDDHIRAVVAIGESADEICTAFIDRRPVRVAGSMDEAVRLAGDAAYPGDTVLLAPGCASFDWYRSYAERGDDFTRAVGEFLERQPPHHEAEKESP